MTPRGRFNLVMSLLMLAAVAFGVWRLRQQGRDAATQSGKITASADQSTAQADAGNDTRQVRTLPFAPPGPAAPMPPWGEPLGANFDALRHRADAGDARAACRIGVELSLCDASRRGTGTAAHQDGALAPAPAGSGADATDPAARPQDQNYCAGVDLAQQGLAAHYLRKAALAGNRDAMLRYAQGAFFEGAQDALDHNRYLQDPGFTDWYREAVPMLQRALRAGDPLAARLLANGYADDHGLLDALIPDDPVQAFGYQLLLSYLDGHPAPGPGALDPRQRADAERLAQRIYRESFGSKPIQDSAARTLDLRLDDPAAAPCL